MCVSFSALILQGERCGPATLHDAIYCVFVVFSAAAVATLSGNAKTIRAPPSSVYLARSLYPPTAPRPSVDFSRPAARPMPAQPPIPDNTPMYCLPSYFQVVTLPITPDGVLNFHSSLPLVSTALI